MASEPKTIEVEPGGEIDHLLDAAAERPLRLLRAGAEFRLHVVEGRQHASAEVDVDPELELANPQASPETLRQRPSAEQVTRSIAGIRASAGGWVGLVDAEEFKRYVRDRRRNANRPPIQW